MLFCLTDYHLLLRLRFGIHVVMSINWTGSGSFQLGKQRRRKEFMVQWHHRSKLQNYEAHAGPQPQEQAGRELGCCSCGIAPEVGVNTDGNQRSNPSTLGAPIYLKDCAGVLRREMSGSSLRELCRWLLSRPDWVGAHGTGDKPVQASHAGEGAKSTPQPRPAPMLERSSHSK